MAALMGAPTCGNSPSRERELEPDKSVYPELHNGRLAQRQITFVFVNRAKNKADQSLGNRSLKLFFSIKHDVRAAKLRKPFFGLQYFISASTE